HAVNAHARLEHTVRGLLRGRFRRRCSGHLAGVGNEYAMITGWRRRLDGLAGRHLDAFVQGREAAAHDAFLNRPLPNANSERDFLEAITSSGRMIFFRSLMTLAFGSTSCSGTPRSTAWRTSL